MKKKKHKPQQQDQHKKDLLKTFSLLFLLLTMLYGCFSFVAFDTLLLYRKFNFELIIPVLLSTFSAVSLMLTLSLWVCQEKLLKVCLYSSSLFPLITLASTYYLIQKYEYGILLSVDTGSNVYAPYSLTAIVLLVVGYTTFVLLKLTIPQNTISKK